MKRFIATAVAGLILIAWAGGAEVKPPLRLEWTDQAGGRFVAPAADRPTVLLFVRPEQLQSQEAVRTAGAYGKKANVAAVLSGPRAGASVPDWSGSVLADPDYKLSGQFQVRVWPTTVIGNSSGEIVGVIAGMPKAFAADLDAYMQRASGRIDAMELKNRLAAHGTVADTPAQEAARHWEVAHRLLGRGHFSEAQSEVEAGLKKAPASPQLKLLQAKILLHYSEATEAQKVLDSVPAGIVPPWHVDVLRARAARIVGRLDEAQRLAEGAVKLNPQPSEALYELGQIHQARGDWQKAAEAYRRAFELCEGGRNLAAEPPVGGQGDSGR